jgi:hypothetical protein
MMPQHPPSLALFPEAIRFYCGLGEQRYNYHPVFTGPYACISPICGTVHKKVNRVTAPEGTLVIQDSGAFNDACMALQGYEHQLTLLKQHRLSPKDALKRQEQHAEAFGYAHQIEARASYDVLIDETWTESEAGIFIREKRRWSETEAELAVDETVAAAAFLDSHRNGAACILSAQGVTPRQYLRCTERILPYLREGDILGLGGFCILGKKPWLLPAFRETMHLVIPFLKREGVKRVHLWGVCFAEALALLLWLCDHDEAGAWDEHHRIAVSNDSVGPSIRPVRKDRQTGYAVWGYASWRNDRYAPPPVLASCKHVDVNGNKAPTCPPETRCRGLERARHIACTSDWLAHFREREPLLYRPSRLPAYHQLSFLEGDAGIREGVSA